MTKVIDFYFDFISPYSFLAHKEIRKIENKASVKVKYRPIKKGQWGTALISLLIRVFFGVAMKVSLKLLYSKK